jgi:Na+/melibiose symporter-like transporter
MMEIQLKVQKPLKDLVYLELKHKILTGEIVSQSAQTLFGLRLLMTIMPMIILLAAVLIFIRKFKLTDAVVQENAAKLRRH